MGLIATLLTLTRSKLATFGQSPGQSVVAQAQGFAGQVYDTEVYQSPGVVSSPPDGTRGIWLPVGGSSRYGVVVATHNYSLNIQINRGETVIYSTDSSGKSQALIKLTATGQIELNGRGKQLVTWDELNTALQNHTHQAGTLASPAGAVTGLTGGPIGLDLSSAKTTTVSTGG